jgi:hypothetical protein
MLEDGRSSHWRLHYQHESWKSKEFGVRDGLGIFVPRTMRRVVLHRLLQLPWFSYGWHYKAFWRTWRAGGRVARAHDRVFDSDDLRAVLSVACARHYVDLDPSKRHVIAIIGDGYGRIANLLLATLPKTLVVLVNLPPSLEVDLASLRLVRPLVKVLEPRGPQDLEAVPADVNVVAIPAERATLLRQLPLDGVFNTSSMQEMDMATIRRYFEILRSTPSPTTWFYCANAVEKKWVDGSVIRFAEYPWSPLDRILLDEVCPWAHRTYHIKPPRYIQHPFRNQHRFAFLHKQG